MDERIRELRKELKLTLEKFGARIGVKKSTLSNIENGRYDMSEQMIKSICREYCVSEEWLRYGIGKMFTTRSTDDELAEIVNDFLLTDSNFYTLVFSIAKSYRNLDDYGKEIINKMIDTALSDIAKREGR